MENENREFNQAWNSLTTRGEMCGEPLRPFTPVGLRKNVKEEGPLYHCTRAALRPGDLLTPGRASNYGSRQTAKYVYLTARREGAALAAELAAGEGPARVYVVEPLGPIEDDPNVTDRKFPGNPTRSYRTRQPLRVVREDSGWTPLPPEALEKIRERIRQAARKGIEAINESLLYWENRPLVLGKPARLYIAAKIRYNDNKRVYPDDTEGARS